MANSKPHQTSKMELAKIVTGVLFQNAPPCLTGFRIFINIILKLQFGFHRFETYLSDHKQLFQELVLSLVLTTNRVVNLEPLLFLLYINDLD